MTPQRTDVTTEVQRLFDAKAAGWPTKYAPGGRLVGRLSRLAGAVAYHLPAGSSVLDLGCGTGELTAAIAAAGMRSTGCDISPEMLRLAAAAHTAGNVDWVELEPGWQVLPFRKDSFDAVIASSVFEYVDDPVAVLRECRRVLRPAGIVLCTVPDQRYPVRWLEQLIATLVREPALGAACRHWPRLGAYLAYLRISRQRHFVRWWEAAALRADLLNVPQVPGPAARSPLRLLTFQRPGDRHDQ
jgi:ubiquinone/menaquinone biosynthesis C-methylase UbiE